MSADAQFLSPYTPRAELIEMFDGDSEFVDSLAAQFTAQCLTALHDIHEALNAGDVAGVSRAAHALKGSVGYFDPGTGHAMVEAIERIPSAEVERLPALVRALELRIDRLRRHLCAEFWPSGGFHSHH
jgi:HPt (histidine-containing phosphotransfer) domain-containing protein